MNQDNVVKIICPRCGSQMNSNSRYCLKCGYLNPNDPANQNMQKYISVNKEDSYSIGSGNTVIKKEHQITNSIASKTGNKLVCFVFNFLLYVICIVLSYLLLVDRSNFSLNNIMNSLFPYVSFLISIVFLYAYSMELIFIKSNNKWWYALIPFYNLCLLTDIVYKEKWLGIVLLIPVIGQIFLIITLYKLALKFKYSGILTILFPIIYIPLMGFGNRLFEDINYIAEDNTLEDDYRRKRVFFILLIAIMVFGAILMFWNNIVDIKSKALRIKNYYYVYVTNEVVSSTKKNIKDGFISCQKYKYKDDRGIYYIEYPDVGDYVYVPLHYYNDVISAYIIIDNNSGNSKYYVSMSDGTFGFPETLYEEISVDKIVPYNELTKRNDINTCVVGSPKITIMY
ncbi:MAG: hypothetical protein IK137_02205 [Bacilli bacterium]|nr:hypothetical protein [Bacilli bacterium]